MSAQKIRAVNGIIESLNNFQFGKFSNVFPDKFQCEWLVIYRDTCYLHNVIVFGGPPGLIKRCKARFQL